MDNTPFMASSNALILSACILALAASLAMLATRPQKPRDKKKND